MAPEDGDDLEVAPEGAAAVESGPGTDDEVAEVPTGTEAADAPVVDDAAGGDDAALEQEVEASDPGAEAGDEELEEVEPEAGGGTGDEPEGGTEDGGE